MRQETRDLVREDRTASLYELHQVIGLLIAMDQLPLTSLRLLNLRAADPFTKV